MNIIIPVIPEASNIKGKEVPLTFGQRFANFFIGIGRLFGSKTELYAPKIEKNYNKVQTEIDNKFNTTQSDFKTFVALKQRTLTAESRLNSLITGLQNKAPIREIAEKISLNEDSLASAEQIVPAKHEEFTAGHKEAVHGAENRFGPSDNRFGSSAVPPISEPSKEQIVETPAAPVAPDAPPMDYVASVVQATPPVPTAPTPPEVPTTPLVAPPAPEAPSAPPAPEVPVDFKTAVVPEAPDAPSAPEAPSAPPAPAAPMIAKVLKPSVKQQQFNSNVQQGLDQILKRRKAIEEDDDNEDEDLENANENDLLNAPVSSAQSSIARSEVHKPGTQPVQFSPSPNRGGLLKDIQKGVQLKKVNKPAEQQKHTTTPKEGLLGGINLPNRYRVNSTDSTRSRDNSFDDNGSRPPKKPRPSIGKK
jgi:hypothetical protein